MDEARFDKLAADALKKIEAALTDIDPDVEADLASDILTIEFTDGKKFIVNSHRAARQIWLAAGARAWHFSPDEVSGKWIDTREGNELWKLLEELISKAAGHPLALKR